jgi:hypothetical protein
VTTESFAFTTLPWTSTSTFAESLLHIIDMDVTIDFLRGWHVFIDDSVHGFWSLAWCLDGKEGIRMFL